MTTRKRYSDETALGIYQRVTNGETQASIARDLGIPTGSMARLIERGRELQAEQERRKNDAKEKQSKEFQRTEGFDRAMSSLPPNPTAAQVESAIRSEANFYNHGAEPMPDPAVPKSVQSDAEAEPMSVQADVEPEGKFSIGRPADRIPTDMQADVETAPPSNETGTESPLEIWAEELAKEDAERDPLPNVMQEVMDLLPTLRTFPDQLELFQQSASAIIDRITTLEKELHQFKSQVMLDIAKALVASVDEKTTDAPTETTDA